MNGRNRSPFTAAQYQELEHQALIFKYMMAAKPIPAELLYPLRGSMDSLTTAKLFAHQPDGWGCFQTGFGRKPDPEPGRCRRTDGKKWRCAKKAFPDSKYCERHMHRGRNRSRKPVEIANNPTPMRTPTPKSYSIAAFSSSPLENHQYYNSSLPLFHSSSSRPPGLGFSSLNCSKNFHLDSGTGTYSDKDYRYLHGLKEDVDEHAFFSKASGTLRSITGSAIDDSWRFTPLRSNSLGQLKQRDGSVLPHTCSHHNFTDLPKQQQEQHCFVLGTDFKTGKPEKVEREEREEGRPQPLHHFFNDWLPKRGVRWTDLEDDQSNKGSFSATQLSISIPNDD